MPRRGLFEPDLGLRVRMWLALALNGLLLVALLALAIWLLTVENGWSILVFVVFFALFGATASLGRRRSRPSDPQVEPEAAERAVRAVSRLSLVADLPVPETVVVPDEAPLSWTTALPGRKPRVHVTTGLLALLSDSEVEAVIAHELSHLGNRDAVVMTVLAAPGVFVLRGLLRAWDDPDFGGLARVGLIMTFGMVATPAFASAILCRVVSRHRELAADHGAALLTDSPTALAAALQRLSAGLHAIPDEDLRMAMASDVLHVVPTSPESSVPRFWATHPPLADRIRRLERIEARLQA